MAMEQARVAALSLNLRTSPNGPVLGVLHENEIVAITGPAEGTWLRVSASIGGKTVTGFASAAFLARETPAPAVSVASSTIPIPDDSTHPVTRSGNLAVGPEGSRFASAFQAGFYAKGVTELETFIAAQGTTLPQTSSVLRVLAAVAQNEGPLEAINSYDNSFLSAGFQQWTLGPDGDPGELPVLLARLAATDAAAFSDCFGRYDLSARATGRTGFLTIAGTQVATATEKEQFRSKEWAYRFWRACHHPSMRAAQMTLAAERIGIARALPMRGHTIASWLTSEHGVALLLDEHVNRPGHLPGTLEGAVNALVNDGSPADPERWGQSEEAALIRAYVDARGQTTMTDPMGRAKRIAASVMAGRLSDDRGSFVP
jgi:hypothetical protein